MSNEARHPLLGKRVRHLKTGFEGYVTKPLIVFHSLDTHTWPPSMARPPVAIHFFEMTTNGGQKLRIAEFDVEEVAPCCLARL